MPWCTTGIGPNHRRRDALDAFTSAGFEITFFRPGAMYEAPDDRRIKICTERESEISEADFLAQIDAAAQGTGFRREGGALPG